MKAFCFVLLPTGWSAKQLVGGEERIEMQTQIMSSAESGLLCGSERYGDCALQSLVH